MPDRGPVTPPAAEPCAGSGRDPPKIGASIPGRDEDAPSAGPPVGPGAAPAALPAVRPRDGAGADDILPALRSGPAPGAP